MFSLENYKTRFSVYGRNHTGDFVEHIGLFFFHNAAHLGYDVLMEIIHPIDIIK
jgi:hypothetical protein